MVGNDAATTDTNRLVNGSKPAHMVGNCGRICSLTGRAAGFLNQESVGSNPIIFTTMKIKAWLYKLIRPLFVKNINPNEDFICMTCCAPVLRRYLFCSVKCGKKLGF